MEDTCRCHSQGPKRRHDDQYDPNCHEGEKRQRLKSSTFTDLVVADTVTTTEATNTVDTIHSTQFDSVLDTASGATDLRDTASGAIDIIDITSDATNVLDTFVDVTWMVEMPDGGDKEVHDYDIDASDDIVVTRTSTKTKQAS